MQAVRPYRLVPGALAQIAPLGLRRRSGRAQKIRSSKMSAEDFARLSTNALIQRFILAAKATPTIYAKNLTAGSLEKTPDRIERVVRIRALAEELRRRNPIDDIRQLFENENPDVRGWAGGQFLLTDPEWAGAALSGLNADITTQEAVDLIRRVRRPPSRQPTLKDMSDDALVQRFEDAATREFATKFLDYANDPYDMAILNRILDEVGALAKELVARDATARLLPLLDHRFDTVRREAASKCLSVAPERAKAVLEAIAAGYDVRERARALDALNQMRPAVSKRAPGANGGLQSGRRR
jgi:hypothetical protein